MLDWLVQLKLAENSCMTCSIQETAFWGNQIGPNLDAHLCIVTEALTFFQKVSIFLSNLDMLDWLATIKHPEIVCVWLATTKSCFLCFARLFSSNFGPCCIASKARPFFRKSNCNPTNFDVLDWLVQLTLSEIACMTCSNQKTAFWATNLVAHLVAHLHIVPKALTFFLKVGIFLINVDILDWWVNFNFTEIICATLYNQKTKRLCLQTCIWGEYF